MPWIQIHVSCRKTDAPSAEAALEAESALSVTVQDAADQPLLEPGPGETPIWERVVVTGLFDQNIDPAEAELRIRAALGSAPKIRIESLDDQPWERAWLEHFRPMRFGDRLWVCPEGHNADKNGPESVILKLDPGLAFGTGTHPTTALCLEWLARTSLERKSVIDFGCGSGILAIAALLLGAESALGIDHDPQALTASVENAEKNDVSERLNVSQNAPHSTAAADIVLANILAGTLVDLSSIIADCVKPSGRLVLSGILPAQSDLVCDAYRDGFSLDPPIERDGWVLVSGTRNSS